MVFRDGNGNTLPVGEITKIETISNAALTAYPITPNKVYRLKAGASGIIFRTPYRGDVPPAASEAYTMSQDEVVYFYSGESDSFQVNTGGASNYLYIMVYE